MDFDEFMSKRIFDMACSTGSKVINKNVDRATLSNMVSLFLGREDVVVAFRDLVMYVARQVGRREIPHDVAREVLSNLREIYDVAGKDVGKLRRAVEKYLVLLRYVYDSGVRKPVSGFDEFLNSFIGGR